MGGVPADGKQEERQLAARMCVVREEVRKAAGGGGAGTAGTSSSGKPWKDFVKRKEGLSE